MNFILSNLITNDPVQYTHLKFGTHIRVSLYNLHKLGID